jgi:hypothetical protein
LAKQLAVFSKTNVIIKILHSLALFWVKNANFLPNFSAKIVKNHSIGPGYKVLGRCDFSFCKAILSNDSFAFLIHYEQRYNDDGFARVA